MKTRATLINKNGKDLIRRLKEEFPDILWYLTLKNEREVCVGIRENKVVVIGTDYENIIDNISL
jgi:hypothetical protein